MPIELTLWRLPTTTDKPETAPTRINFTPLDLESRLQSILSADISIVDPNLMVIGREVMTSWGKRIDILAINRDGNLVVIELKRDKTPRDIVAQVLEYGAWVRRLHNDDIAQLFDEYQKRYFPNAAAPSIDEAFCKRFNVPAMPDELNEAHELLIVASYLDTETERIVQYLSEEYEARINAVFFRVFKDDGREYLSRVWLRDPMEESAAVPTRDDSEWNGEYYMSFGEYEDRTWEEAVKYNFVCGGGGAFYIRTLEMLEPGARIWVNVPQRGYVGVGIVKEKAVPIDEFMVTSETGEAVHLTSLNVKAAKMVKKSIDPEKVEMLVRVEWIKTVPVAQAIKEKGFFGNQNTVARPRVAKWQHTVERLKQRFGVS